MNEHNFISETLIICSKLQKSRQHLPDWDRDVRVECAGSTSVLEEMRTLFQNLHVQPFAFRVILDKDLVLFQVLGKGVVDCECEKVLLGSVQFDSNHVTEFVSSDSKRARVDFAIEVNVDRSLGHGDCGVYFSLTYQLRHTAFINSIAQTAFLWHFGHQMLNGVSQFQQTILQGWEVYKTSIRT